MATANDSFNVISDKSFGFIGLGIMGWGMAKNLRAKIPTDSMLYICEVNKPRRDEFAASTAGKIQVVESPREIAEKSDIIITMLPRGEHVREVFTNPQTGLLSVAGSVKMGSKIFIDCSTIDVKTSQEVAAAVEASDLGCFADAPVSGGQGGANTGTLTFMVGGSPESFETAKPTLELMVNPENLFHCGKAGAGLVTKLINNYLSAVNMIGVCEGMNMGRLYGLDPMAMELSEQLGAKSLLAPVVRDMYDCAVQNAKCRDKDFRSIYRLFSEENGDQLPRKDLKN
ncbi:hypothetical protein ACHAPD_004775 [Fusarium lateritium]